MHSQIPICGFSGTEPCKNQEKNAISKYKKPNRERKLDAIALVHPPISSLISEEESIIYPDISCAGAIIKQRPMHFHRPAATVANEQSLLLATL